MGAGCSREVPAAAALLTLLFPPLSAEAPEVEVYARNRAVDGEENTLNCFVSGFYPASIDIALLRNGEPMIGVQYGDMSFNDKWYFQRLVHAPFVPHRGDIYVCRVTHSAFTEPQSFRWGMVCLLLPALPPLPCQSQSLLISARSDSVPLLGKWECCNGVDFGSLVPYVGSWLGFSWAAARAVCT